MKDRIVWIDIAKGILICLVFLGHITQYQSMLSDVIFSFHMPAFFILSGYTFYYDDELPFRSFVLKNVKGTLVPYFFFCIIGALIHLVWGQYELFGTEMLRQIFITCMPDLCYCGAGWFLVTLFFSNLLMYLWCKLIESQKSFGAAEKALLLVFVFMFAANGLILNRGFGVDRLPFRLDCSLMGFFFILIGYYFKKKHIIGGISKNNRVLLTIVLLAVYFPVMKVNGWVNIVNCCYNNPFFFLVESITGSFLVFILAQSLESKKAGPLLNTIGRHSLPMFMMHGMFLSFMITQYGIPIGAVVSVWQSVAYAFVLVLVTLPLAILYNYGIAKISQRSVLK